MKKSKKILSVFLMIAVIFGASSCHKQNNSYENIKADNEILELHFIDVGQADCSLIISGEKAMLIDGGNVSDGSLIVSYLKKNNIDELSYVVCTHAHEDHVGGLSAALHNFSVDTVYAPKTGVASKAYENFLKKAKNANKYKNPTAGEMIFLGDCKITFLAPIRENYEDINNTSIVLKAEYFDTSFLFMADAEREAETDILNSGADVSADVLRIAHHGSGTSSSYRFLNEVMPRYAVISVGKDNSYGHPHSEALSKLSDLEAEIYRTDEKGDIIAKSDGKNIEFNFKKDAELQKTEESSYIGNKKSEIFHRNSCKSLPSEKNRVYFSSRKEAENEDYRPCTNCNP